MIRTRLELNFLTFLMIKGEEIRKLIRLYLSLCYLLKYSGSILCFKTKLLVWIDLNLVGLSGGLS